METKKLNALIQWHVKLKAQIAERDAACKEANAEDKEKLAKVQAKLQEVIHKDNEEGLAKVALPDGSYTAYARYEDKVKMKDRDALVDEYILDGIPAKYHNLLRGKLEIFSNTLVKDPVTEYREATGAEEENGRLVGGDLPPGVGIYTHKDVRIQRGNK